MQQFTRVKIFECMMCAAPAAGILLTASCWLSRRRKTTDNEAENVRYGGRALGHLRKFICTVMIVLRFSSLLV